MRIVFQFYLWTGKLYLHNLLHPMHLPPFPSKETYTPDIARERLE